MSTEARGNDTSGENEESLRNEGLPTRVERLFRQQNPALVRMLRARLNDREAAEEVAQEAYEEVFRRDKAGTLEKLSAATLEYLRNYLFTTARNLATDRLRQRAMRLRKAHLVLTSRGGSGETPSAEELCIRQEEWECLQRAIQELPYKCRQAFLLVEFECLPVSRVAMQLGVKPNTVYQLCKRSYEHLMKAFATRDQLRGRPA
jgi:RNA polymerase sigma factor (sigma-70 family)